MIWSYIELFGEERLQRAVFMDQAPLQNTAADWQYGSKGCYDTVSLRKLQAALHTDMTAFAKGVFSIAHHSICHSPRLPQGAEIQDSTEHHFYSQRAGHHIP